MEAVGTKSAVRVLGIGGSTREASKSLLALKVALRMAAHEGAETSLASVRDLDLPIYNGERRLEDYPPSLPWLLSEVRAADAILVCSPTYHGTISGATKNVLDALEFLANDEPRYLGYRSVGLLGYGGASAMNVINSVYHCIRTLNGLVVPTWAIISGAMLDAENLQITDASTRQRVTNMVREMIDLADVMRARRAPH